MRKDKLPEDYNTDWDDYLYEMERRDTVDFTLRIDNEALLMLIEKTADGVPVPDFDDYASDCEGTNKLWEDLLELDTDGQKERETPFYNWVLACLLFHMASWHGTEFTGNFEL